MRPGVVVVLDVLGDNADEVPFATDQEPVQALGACAGDPAFGYSIAPHRQLHPIRMIGTGVSG